MRRHRPDLADAPLQPLADTGLAHWHVRLQGTPWLVRVPKQSQMALSPEDNLVYQQACFAQAAPSGHTPRLLGVLPVSGDLPRGALLVEAIAGHAARLPQDLTAIAEALAALHALPVPSEPTPLHRPADPLADLLAAIDQQAAHLSAAGLSAPARQAIELEREGFAERVARADRPPCSLIAFDAHPGNFLCDGDGRAVLVDLEKLRIGPPGLDLAHATLYTSTTWDVASRAVLDTAQERAFITAWAARVGTIAPLSAAWHVPLRRAMWLWSITWCAQWRVLSGLPPGGQGADWSGALSEPALVTHVRNRVDHYLDANTIAQLQAGFDALERALRT
ncbi:MAG: phosphotransferase [Hydrogenophaga sp.]|uniref:phosphotransferase n=1 Tax=Hydrogenophaga sp. TaxID=1904254 RepID=UPI001D5E21B6|nr:phosphotransferase [Hydrogenophaga sp.]MBX3610793.1 phosphotransferase [Hydrogenophaga sp.]